jgi:hypothetical protein
MSKVARNKSKFPLLTKTRIIAIGITVKILKNVVNRLRGLSG